MASHIARAFKAAITLLAATGQSPLQDPAVGDTIQEAVTLDGPPYKNTIEVLAPPYRNVQGEPCVVPLGRHEFAFSYGTPYTTTFAAAACDASHSVVYLKWTASSPLGVQYDRIAAVWVNGVELLRTSTEEPDRKSGVAWEIAKDVSNYYDAIAGGGSLVVALDNVIDGPYNSSFTVALQAEFYKPLDNAHTPRKPDLVVPISKSNSTYGWFTVQPSSAAQGANSALVSIPRNTEELYLELFLSHHQCDEFWYSNPPSDFAQAYGACGNGPFREVQVLVDGELTGVVWPFPLLFTGGLNPYLWRPIVAIGAYQVPTYMINLTPFLGKFVDGQAHNVTFAVDYGIDFWPIDGNLLVYVDADGAQTQAQVMSKDMDSHIVPISSQQIAGINANFSLVAKRHWRVLTSVTTSKGTRVYELEQQLRYLNAQEYSQDGEVGTFDATTSVKTSLQVRTPKVASLLKGGGAYSTLASVVTHEEYPIVGKTFYRQFADGTFRLEADLKNGFHRKTDTSADMAKLRLDVEPKDVVIALQGSAAMQSGLGGNGTTRATYTERSQRDGCFTRAAHAVQGVLLQDESSTDCARVAVA